MTKKLGLILLALFLVLTFVACQTEPEQPITPPADDETPDAPSDQPGNEETPDPMPPEDIVLSEIKLIVDGESDYTIVYDDSDSVIAEYAKALAQRLNAGIEVIGISEAEGDYGHEIVIGDIRASGREAAEALGGGDFSISVVDDDLVMCASNSRLYAYLFDVFTDKYLAGALDGTLTIRSEQNFLYSTSSLRKTSYVDYLKLHDGMTRELIEEIFDYCSFTAEDGTTLPYRLYVPYEYDPSKEYPVLIVLHGAGERGTDNRGNIYHMLHDMFSHGDTPLDEAIIIAPQCPEGNQWVDTPWANGNYSVDRVPMSNELNAVLELLWDIEEEFSTDYHRYYITGLSMGGFGTWDMIMRQPTIFAAAVPICGGADPSYAVEICNMPIYTVHGSADTTVPVAGTRAMVEALKMQGSTVIYQELEGEGHGVWNWTTQNSDVWEWLFSQSLPDVK